MEQIVYFEDYEVGLSRTTSGRTITETDFVVVERRRPTAAG